MERNWNGHQRRLDSEVSQPRNSKSEICMPMQLGKFRPRDAIQILLSPNRPIFQKTWALGRLLTWVALDQRPGRRKYDPDTGWSNQTRFRAKNAKAAGHLIICSLLEQCPRTNQSLSVLNLFFATGGFGLFLKSGRSAQSLLSALGKADRDLSSVHDVALYMLRYKRYVPGGEKLTIQYAKQFVTRKQDSFKLRTAAKIWETNKQAAPYIFALFELFRRVQNAPRNRRFRGFSGRCCLKAEEVGPNARKCCILSGRFTWHEGQKC